MEFKEALIESCKVTVTNIYDGEMSVDGKVTVVECTLREEIKIAPQQEAEMLHFDEGSRLMFLCCEDAVEVEELRITNMEWDLVEYGEIKTLNLIEELLN